MRETILTRNRTTFAERCLAVGLKPEYTRFLKLASVERGITDRIASRFELACLDAGFDPKKTSIELLASKSILGLNFPLAAEDLVEQIGPNWKHCACMFGRNAGRFSRVETCQAPSVSVTT